MFSLGRPNFWNYENRSAFNKQSRFAIAVSWDDFPPSKSMILDPSGPLIFDCLRPPRLCKVHRLIVSCAFRLGLPLRRHSGSILDGGRGDRNDSPGYRIVHQTLGQGFGDAQQGSHQEAAGTDDQAGSNAGQSSTTAQVCRSSGLRSTPIRCRNNHNYTSLEISSSQKSTIPVGSPGWYPVKY